MEKLRRLYPAFIIFGVFTIYIISAFTSTDETALTEEKKKEKKKYARSVSCINHHYKIDTNYIVKSSSLFKFAEDLKKENFIEKKTQEKIPGFILAFLDSISPGHKFKMADPGQDWDADDITDYFARIEGTYKASDLPNKQMIHFSIGKNLAILSFLDGGVQTWQNLTLIQFENNKVVDFWFGDAQPNPGSAWVTKKEELLKFLIRDKDGC